MKGLGWIAILLALGAGAYLVLRDLEALRGGRAEHAVLEPLREARQAADAVRSAQEALREAIRKSQE